MWDKTWEWPGNECVCLCGWFLFPWSLPLDHAGLHACSHVCVYTVNKATSHNLVCSPSLPSYGEKWWTTLTLIFPLPSYRPSPSHPSRWEWKDLGSTNTQHTMHLLTASCFTLSATSQLLLIFCKEETTMTVMLLFVKKRPHCDAILSLVCTVCYAIDSRGMNIIMIQCGHFAVPTVTYHDL